MLTIIQQLSNVLILKKNVNNLLIDINKLTTPTDKIFKIVFANEILDDKRKSYKIDINSDLHKILSTLYLKMKAELGIVCGDPFGCHENDIKFHVEMVTSKNNPLKLNEMEIRNNNYEKYNNTTINLNLKNNWNLIGNAFGLIIDENGKSGKSNKNMHATLGFFKNGCDLQCKRKCIEIVKSVVGELK